MPPVGVDGRPTGGGRPRRRGRAGRGRRGSRPRSGAGHGEAVAVEEAGLEQLAHDHGDAADAVDVDHVVRGRGAWCRRCGARGPPTRLKSSRVELDACLVGDGQEMEHGVGRAAEGHDDGDGVLEGLLGHDLRGAGCRAPAARRRPGPTRRRSPRGGGRRPAARPSPGSDMPMASATDAMVLAVNIPAHDPAVGTGVVLDERELLVAERPGGVGADGLEDAHDVEGLGSGRPGSCRGGSTRRRGRPTGRLRRAAAMSMPGSDLSQPAKVTMASKRSACIIVSIESAMTSRETSEARMPSWPMEMPSETAMVMNSMGKPPAARTPSLDRLASRSSGHVARRDLVPRRGHADLGLVPVVVGHADGPQHGPGRGAGGPVGDLVAADLRAVGPGSGARGRAGGRRSSGVMGPRLGPVTDPLSRCGRIGIVGARVAVAGDAVPRPSARAASTSITASGASPSRTTAANPASRASTPISTRWP